MLESTMAAAAGGATGLLGQLGHVLSAPRRFAWDALGLPETGSDLLAQTFGMDAESPWTKALGVGAEVALDPLTYAGFLMGGPIAKMGAQAVNARRTAGLGSEIEALAAARRGAHEGLVARAGHEAATVDRYAAQAAELSKNHDLAGIAGGKSRTYNSFTDPLADSMSNSGMGSLNEAGQLETLGETVPYGVRMKQLQGASKGQKAGSVMEVMPQFEEGNPFGMAHPYKTMDPLLPDELAHLQELAKGQVGDRWRTLREGPGRAELADRWSRELAAEANATRPMPSLGGALRDRFLPTAPLSPEALATPLPDAFSATQRALAAAIERKKALEAASAANAIGGLDYAKMGGASYLASLGLGGSGGSQGGR